MSDASIAAAENTTVLTGDLGYMDFPRSQIDVLIQQGEMKGETLHAPTSTTTGLGWVPSDAGAPLTYIWCMSMQDEDMARLKKQRNHDAATKPPGLHICKANSPSIRGGYPAPQSRSGTLASGFYAQRPARSIHLRRLVSPGA